MTSTKPEHTLCLSPESRPLTTSSDLGDLQNPTLSMEDQRNIMFDDIRQWSQELLGEEVIVMDSTLRAHQQLGVATNQPQNPPEVRIITDQLENRPHAEYQGTTAEATRFSYIPTPATVPASSNSDISSLISLPQQQLILQQQQIADRHRI